MDTTLLKAIKIKENKCPRCKKELQTRKHIFYWRGTYFSGLVCKDCNSLYDNPKDSFAAHVGMGYSEE